MLERLLRAPPAPSDCARWYADPLPIDVARSLRRRAQLGIARRATPERAGLQLAALIAGHWLGFDTEHDCARLRTEHTAAVERALLELVCGQLFMACRRRGAHARLQEGFLLAAPLLPAWDYFRVRRRHELLALLPLAPADLTPQPLAALLREARVIELLRHAAGARPRPAHPDPGDTVG